MLIRSGSPASLILAGDTVELPKELPEVRNRLVDVASPGYRKVLGYE
jgi:hypothetical protein